MPKVSVRTSVVVSQFLRQKRQDLGLSLHDVSTRMAEAGERFPPSTLARIEQGKLDPGVWRLHQLLRLYKVPPQRVADLVELEAFAVEQPPASDLDALFREGIECWKQGDLAKGLAYLFAVRQYQPSTPDAALMRQKATLSFAIAARDLGKLRLAKDILDELLLEPPDHSLIVHTLVAASSVWCALGSSDVALGLLVQAETYLGPENANERAWVAHQKAKTLCYLERLAQAHEALQQALRGYRAAGDVYGEARALVLSASIEERRADPNRALACAREALAFAEANELAQVVGSCHLEVGRLLVKSGSPRNGIVSLQEALGRAVLLGDRGLEFIAHYHLWKAYEQLGNQERARHELESAGYFSQFVEEASIEAVEVRTILGTGDSDESRRKRKRQLRHYLGRKRSGPTRLHPARSGNDEDATMEG